MSIASIISERSIAEIVHFTTNRGIAGVLASKALKARSLLPADKYLEHIYLHNCECRDRDAQWHGYVNLSITRINARLFGISAGNWHRDIDGWWCILSFDPSILTHDGVYFATTNNMYSGVQRRKGPEGLEALFAQQITKWPGKVVHRTSHTAPNRTTCSQAEVLYPQQVDLNHLLRVYVRDGSHVDDIAGMCAALSLPPIECGVAPEAFIEN